MRFPSSLFKSVPKNFYEFKVLLVNPSKRTLQHHAYVLLQSKYKVTSTMKISEALSMIMRGEKFDCVLFDADSREMDLPDFLNTMWNHQPQLRIIVMSSNKSHIQIAREYPANDGIWFLEKPCGVSNMCNLLQTVCRKGLASDEGTSADINSQRYGAMGKPVAFVDLSSDDDEPSTPKNIYTGTVDKGKEPILEPKRKHESWTEGAYPKAILNHMNVPWPGLTRDQVASHSQRNQESENYSMKPWVGGQMQNNINFQVENYTSKRSRLLTASDNNASLLNCSTLQRALTTNVSGMSSVNLQQIRANLQAVQLLLTQKTTTTINSSTVDQAMEHHSSVQFQPLVGETSTSTTAFGLVDQANMHRYGDQFELWTREITKSSDFVLTGNSSNGIAQGSGVTVNRNGVEPVVTGEKISHHALGEAIALLSINETVESQYNVQTDVNVYLNGFHNDFMDVDGNAASEVLATVDRFGIPVESCETAGGGAEASLDDMTFPEFNLEDQGGNGENLLDVENSIVNFGHGSASFSFPTTSGVENNSEAHISPVNSAIPLDGSEGGKMDEDWYLNLLYLEQEDLLFSNNKSHNKK